MTAKIFSKLYLLCLIGFGHHRLPDLHTSNRNPQNDLCYQRHSAGVLHGSHLHLYPPRLALKDTFSFLKMFVVVRHVTVQQHEEFTCRWPAWAERRHLSEHLVPLPPPQACTPRSHSVPVPAPTSPTCAWPHSTWRSHKSKPVQVRSLWCLQNMLHGFWFNVLRNVRAKVCTYLSRNVRVLAWMMLRSHSAGFLPGSACLCPNTSMATAPSVRYSIKSSVTVTACSYDIKNLRWEHSWVSVRLNAQY